MSDSDVKNPELAAMEDEGETSTALNNAARAILNRIPSQWQ